MAYTNLPPNLYDYFSTINQRIRKLESAPDQAMTTAVSAQGTASNASTQAITAEAQATTALANAAVAYSAAIGSLQPSASTIVNSSNQMTAISTNGITVYSGSSPSSGARVVMNSAGIAGYNSGGSATFAINASTGAASFAGSITGSTITGSTLNIGGNFYVDGATGFLTCTGATITGTITATSGSFTGSVYASSGSIAGFTIGSSQLSNSQMTIYSNGNITSLGAINAYYVAAGISLTSAGTLVVSGNSTLGNTTTTTNLTINSTANIVGGYGVTSDWSPNGDGSCNLGISGSHRWAHVYASNTTITTSDQRLKTNITTSALGLDFINSLRPVSYQWIEGSKKLVVDAEGNPIVESVDENGKPVHKTESIPGKRTHYGLIAQEVKSALDAANVGDFAGWVQDDLSNPDSFQSVSYEQFISPLIKAVQELSNRLNKLEGK
jgi:hypothetical protein